VTDFDCWHQSVAAVDIGEILRVMKLNVELAQKAIVNLAHRLDALDRSCPCPRALDGAIITDSSVIPPKAAASLDLIVGKYLKRQ
jgi:5'-methylthioadenosine phosphorylase